MLPLSAAQADVIRHANESPSFDMATATAETRASLSCESRWDDLLCAVPSCLELLAKCVVASTSDFAQRVELKPPSDGFKYLKG